MGRDPGRGIVRTGAGEALVTVIGTEVVLGCGVGDWVGVGVGAVVGVGVGAVVGVVLGDGDGDEALLLVTIAVPAAAAPTAPATSPVVAPAPAPTPPTVPVRPSEPALAGAPSSLNGVNIDWLTPVTDPVSAPAAAVATSDWPAASVKTCPFTSVTCTGSAGLLNAYTLTCRPPLGLAKMSPTVPRTAIWPVEVLNW